MCLLESFCIYDSAKCSVYSLKDVGKTRITIRVEEDEILRVYNFQDYLKSLQENQKKVIRREDGTPITRAEILMIGKVGNTPWVVILVEVKRRGHTSEAITQTKEALQFVLAKGCSEEGDRHHQECAHLLPDGRGHLVCIFSVGHFDRGLK